MPKPIIHKNNTQTKQYKKTAYNYTFIFIAAYFTTIADIQIYNRIIKDLNIKKLVSKISKLSNFINVD